MENVTNENKLGNLKLTEHRCDTSTHEILLESVCFDI